MILFRIFLLLIFQVSLSYAGELTLLSSGPLVADGETESVVQLYHPEIFEDSRFRINSTGGEVISNRSSDDGAVSITLLPDSGAEEMVLSVRLTNGFILRPRFSLEEDVVVPLQGAVSGALVVTVEPEVLPPGDRRAVLTIQGGGDVAVSSSSGTLGDVRNNGDGSWSVDFTAPINTNPEEVVFAAVDRLRGGSVAASASIALGVVQSSTFEGPPGGRAVLFVGEQEFGPSLISPAGTVAFDVPLYPGVNEYTLHTFAPGGRNEEIGASLTGSYDAPMVFAPYASPLVVPAGVPFELSMVIRNGSGAPFTNISAIEIDSTCLSSIQMIEPGLFSLTLTPPVLGGDFSAEVRVNGDNVSVEGTGVVPSPLLSASSDPAQLHPDTSRITATVEVRDHTGQKVDVPPNDIAFAVDGGTVRGRVRQVETGVFTREIDVTDDEQLLFTVLPPVALSNRTPVDLSVWTGVRGEVAAAGAVVPLFVIAEDAFGLPVANQRIQLSTNSLGSLPASMTTGEKGVGVVFFRPALNDLGPLRLTATTDFDTSSTFVWRMPEGVVHTPVPLGNVDERAAVERWRGSLPLVTVRPALVVAPAVVDVVDVVPSTPVNIPATIEPVEEEVASAEQAVVVPIEVIEEPTVPSPARPDRPAFDGMRAKVRVGIVQMDRSFTQSSNESTENVPSNATFSESLPIGALGLRFAGQISMGGLLTDVDLSMAAHSIDSGSGGSLNYAYSLTAGGVVQRPWKGGFLWEVGGWFHRGDGLTMSYNADQTALIQTPNAFNGLRVGGGIVGQLGPLDTRLRIAETLAPLPVATHLAARVDMEVPDTTMMDKPVWGALDTTLDLLHRSNEIGDDSAFVFERRIAVTLMVGIDL